VPEPRRHLWSNSNTNRRKAGNLPGELRLRKVYRYTGERYVAVIDAARIVCGAGSMKRSVSVRPSVCLSRRLTSATCRSLARRGQHISIVSCRRRVVAIDRGESVPRIVINNRINLVYFINCNQHVANFKR